MRNGVKLVEVELVAGANVDVGAPILGLVAVLRCGEDCSVDDWLAKGDIEPDD